VVRKSDEWKIGVKRREWTRTRVAQKGLVWFGG